MSQSQRTYQTIDTLNISQGHETPACSSPSQQQSLLAEPPPRSTILVEDSLKLDPTAVHDSVEVVEDSFGTRKVATAMKVKRAPVRPSEEPQLEEERLYSVTPDLPRPARARRRPSTTEPQENQRPPSRNALSNLLSKGAVIHHSAPTPAISARRAPIVEDDDEDELQRSQDDKSAAAKPEAKLKRPKGKAPLKQRTEDHLQDSDDEVSAPPSSQARASKQQRKTSVASKLPPTMSKKLPHAASKPTATGATGSVALLRQRRGLDGPSESTPGPGKAKSPLQPRDPNAQTPAAAARDQLKKVPPASTASVTGKLRPVKKGMFAQTPIGAPSSQGPKKAKVVAKQKATGAPSKCSGNATVNSDSKPTMKAADKKRSSKGPAKSVKGDEADNSSVYDLPEGSEHEDDRDYEPSQQKRKSKATQRKRAPAPDSAAGSPGLAKKPARKSKAKTSKPSLVDEPQPEGTDAETSKSMRGRMKAESGIAAPSATKARATVVAKKVQAKFVPSAQPDAETPNALQDEVDDDQMVRSADHYDGVSDGGDSRAAAANGMVKVKQEKLNADDRTTTKRPAAKAKPGASQQDAIELSDAMSSSADEDEEPVKAHLPSAPTISKARAAGRPTVSTPAAMPSSPPVAGSISTKPTTAGLIDPASVRKATVIAFDRSGPRNQGTASGRATRSSLAPADRSSLPPVGGVAGHLQERQQLQLIFAAKQAKPVANQSSAAPRIVASDAQEALAGFKRRSIAPPKPALGKTKAPQDQLDRDMQANLESNVKNIDDYEDDTTLVENQEPQPEVTAKAVNIVRTASQIQMPPPPVTKPERKKPVPAMGAPVVPSMSRAEADEGEHVVQSATDSAKKLSSGKRRRAAEAADVDPQPKRVRMEEGASFRPESQDSATVATVVLRKPSALIQQAEQNRPRPSSQQQARRAKSHGTVDIHGSPVPEGMIIEGLGTVLETYSQQAPMSSDKSIGKRSVAQDIDMGDGYLPPAKAAYKRPARLSSNTKAVPAAPSQESQAVTHVARVAAAPHNFVTSAQAAHPPTDPFTSSAEERKGSGESAFFRQLKQQTANASATRKSALLPPTSTSESRYDYDDPDKTLVEPDESVRPQKRHRRPKRLPSFESLTSSSSGSTDSEDSSTTQQDIGLWRSGIKPHERDLFDALVMISHRLVRHLVGKEEAASTAIDDFRRRGEELVRALRAGRESELQAYYTERREKKKRLRREMETAGQKLKACGEEVNVVRREVKRQAAVAAAAAKGGVDGDGLADVMEAFC